jgi:protoporphyrinogen oxidase
MRTKKVVVIGAGPAGLTAAYELAKKPGFKVVVLEATDAMGGIARTVNCNGNLMDVGGHRFITEIPEIEKWWQEMMPVMERERHSRILFNEKFYDYPVKLKFGTLKNMGLATTLVASGSFIKSKFCKRKVKSLEDYYINRFGKKMYRMFFEKYTENLWGRHPRDISPEYGMERVNDKISILGLIFGAFKRKEVGDDGRED